MDKKTRRQVIAYCILFVGLVIGLTIILLPYFQRLSEPDYQAGIQKWINKMGGAGMLLVLAIQIVQVIIAFIPGEPVEILAGALYGNVSGLLICLAPIPCVLSSTMIGSTMRQGDWELSLTVFIITGLIGIAGISFKDKAIDFCRRKTKGLHNNTTKCESLDFVEAAHSNKVYPLLYCRMVIQGNLDIEKLKDAVNLSSQYVPEILYTYDFKRAGFVNRGLTVENVFILDRLGLEADFWWDLSKNAQLQISIYKEEQQSIIVIGMSHILSDGAGFLQYLYLLAALYNGASPGSKLQNTRDISSLLKNIHVQPPTEQTKCGRRIDVVPLRPFDNGMRFFCLNSTIAPNDLTAIHAKAKKSGATLNHAFMAAYARVIARLQKTDRIVLPCPADLRRFQPKQDNLTVANMTGIYKKIIVEINSRHGFSETLSQVCIEMNLQKDRCRCFAGMWLLNFAFHKTPHFILKKAIRAGYPLLPVSYTNMGIVDHEKLYFQDCHIKECCLTGTYRLPPDFQLSVSTFRNTCTLNCTLIGEDGDKSIGQFILEQVKKELLEWIQE